MSPPTDPKLEKLLKLEKQEHQIRLAHSTVEKLSSTVRLASLEHSPSTIMTQEDKFVSPNFKSIPVDGLPLKQPVLKENLKNNNRYFKIKPKAPVTHFDTAPDELLN
jgi:hypothetical protein